MCKECITMYPEKECKCKCDMFWVDENDHCERCDHTVDAWLGIESL